MAKADKGKGLLVSGGYDVHKIAEIDEHRDNNEDGQNQRGSFVPGSGGMNVGVNGKQKPMDSLFDIGGGPDDFNKTENQARRIREQWLNETSGESAA
jgi:hypothetical protein